MKATHVLCVATFITQSALSLIPPFHEFALRMKLAITVHQEARLWILLLAGRCYRQLMPFVMMIPVETTLSRGFAKDELMNTVLRMLAEGFGTRK